MDVNDNEFGNVKRNDFDDLRNRVNHLEYEELKEVRRDVQTIKEDMVKNNVLLQQSIASSEKLNATLDTVQTTMVQLTESMKHNTDTTNSLSKKVSNLEEKIDTVDDKVNKRTNIDVSEWLQKNWFNLVIIIGIVVYIVLGKYVIKF